MKWMHQIQRLDEACFIWLSAQLRFTPRAQPALWISRSGDGYGYLAFIVFVYGIGWSDASLLALLLLTGFAIELPCYWALKNLLRRPRPYQQLSPLVAVITASDKFSFPSGHTTAAFLFASLCATLLPELSFYLYAWASAVGLSRVALGVHYPTDIAAGAVLGVLLSSLTLSIFGVF